MADEERRHLRGLHQSLGGVCAVCGQAMPCDALALLDELERVEAVVREATDHYEAVVARQEEPAECWRHADGSVRTDHMDTRPGDYFGAARQEEGTRAGLVQVGWKMCTDGRLVPNDGYDHAGRCSECVPVYVRVGAGRNIG